METYRAPSSSRGLGLSSLAFGFLGVAFCWWLPLGMVLSLTGLMLGLIGWVMGYPRAGHSGLWIAGTLGSVAGLFLCSVIAAYGLEIFRLAALR
jgi:hypothetical protein